MFPIRASLVLLLAFAPAIARATDANPEEYRLDRWRHTRDAATLGGVIGGLGVATAAAGFALKDYEQAPSNLLLGTGTLAAGSGAVVMGAVGLQQRTEFLDRENSPVGAYLSFGMVGLSGIGLLSAVATPVDAEVHDPLLYGSAAIAATAVIPAALQLAGNAGHFRSRRKPSVSWSPMLGLDRVGGMAVVRW